MRSFCVAWVFFEEIVSYVYVAMVDPSVRIGAKKLIQIALAKATQCDEGLDELSERLEQRCYDVSQQNMNDSRTIYAELYSGLCRALPAEYGDFLETTLATRIVDGAITIEEAVTTETLNAHTCTDPRQRTRAMFYKFLAQDPRFNEAQCREYAKQIERGCYNAAIARCAESADSYRRQWDSPMFVNVYGGRCGSVAANIDPQGAVAKNVEGGTRALDCLASGEWKPAALGEMSASDLCPQAGKAERAIIMQRVNQKIEEKTSALFRCPRCHMRNHTYRQVQIGAGDEPSTFMCTCKECGENYEGRA